MQKYVIMENVSEQLIKRKRKVFQTNTFQKSLILRKIYQTNDT
jgi:hypothetical protein